MSIDNYVNGMSEGSQRRGSVKDKVYKRPVSILVVIYAQDTKRVLMLQRRDDPDFWQSVTGSVEEGETAPQAAMRDRYFLSTQKRPIHIPIHLPIAAPAPENRPA